MTEDGPDPNNEGRVEAGILVKKRGWEFYRAFDHVLVKWLCAGNAEPLLDLIYLQRRAPGKKAAEFIASIVDNELLLDEAFGSSGDRPMVDVRSRFRHCKLKLKIVFKENRGRGRPAPGRDSQFKRDISLELILGFSCLASGRAPHAQFWIHFADALANDRHQRSSDKAFPYKAALVRTDGAMGRPRDPKLILRDHALYAFVAEKIERGMKYEAAVAEVCAEIKAQGRRENWQGWVEPKTIRAAYDKAKRRSRQF
jgi:hypothetical protein